MGYRDYFGSQFTISWSLVKVIARKNDGYYHTLHYQYLAGIFKVERVKLNIKLGVWNCFHGMYWLKDVIDVTLEFLKMLVMRNAYD